VPGAEEACSARTILALPSMNAIWLLEFFVSKFCIRISDLLEASVNFNS